MVSPSYRVLIVDDEEMMRSFLLSLFSRNGHHCEATEDGRVALDKIRSRSFDAAIVDIVMPKMDGITLTKEIQKLDPNLSVIIITGHTVEHSAESAIGAGAREFIKKPFSVLEFTLRFNKMMRDREIFRQIEAKKGEILFNSNRKSQEKIRDLERELETLKGRLSSRYFSR